MSREWQPGDVIADEFGTAFFVVEVTANSRAAWGEGVHGVRADGNGYNVAIIRGARPLVVIDPEDRDQMERLAAAYRDLADGYAELLDEPWSMLAMRMRQTLREFANPKPPKPDEPTGLGAVVEDADGVKWVRWQSGPRFWVRAPGSAASRYDQIDVVRVLSEGVTP